MIGLICACLLHRPSKTKAIYREKAPEESKHPRWVYQKTGKKRMTPDARKAEPIADLPVAPSAVQVALASEDGDCMIIGDDLAASGPSSSSAKPVATPCRAAVMDKGWKDLPQGSEVD